MKFWKRLTACALTAAMAAGFAGCGSSGGDASKKEDSGKEDAVIPYDSDFTIGVDKIAEAMGAGWNVGNQLEANSGGKVNETVWGNPEITQELISAVLMLDSRLFVCRFPIWIALMMRTAIRWIPLGWTVWKKWCSIAIMRDCM